MNKALIFSALIKRAGLLLVASSIVLSGCQGFLLTYKGAKVLDTYRIALVDETQRSSRYQSSDLTVDYNVVRNGDELQLSGAAEYMPQVRKGFGQISYFFLSVFLTDQDGNILQEKRITTLVNDDSMSPMRFSEKIQLPPGTVNMAFSYSIKTRGSANRQALNFWGVPIVR